MIQLFCSLIHNNETVSSSCESDRFESNTDIQQQLIIQPLNSIKAQMVIISNVANITDRLCVQYEGESYGIVIPVNEDNIFTPIGRSPLIYNTSRKGTFRYQDYNVTNIYALYLSLLDR